MEPLAIENEEFTEEIQELKKITKRNEHAPKKRRIDESNAKRRKNAESLFDGIFLEDSNIESEPEELLDLHAHILESATPFSNVKVAITALLDKSNGESFTTVISKRSPKSLNMIVDFLYCFALIKRNVLLIIQHSRYDPYLSGFYYTLSCNFCHEKQYGIICENGNFRFNYAVADSEVHQCNRQNLISIVTTWKFKKTSLEKT